MKKLKIKKVSMEALHNFTAALYATLNSYKEKEFIEVEEILHLDQVLTAYQTCKKVHNKILALQAPKSNNIEFTLAQCYSIVNRVPHRFERTQYIFDLIHRHLTEHATGYIQVNFT